ncbi:MAG: ATP-binding protein [Candidatus Algichlamydia australiensis]|nr:ATP-binding protein [Chlamydiales bacterium]
MIPRQIEKEIRQLMKGFPIIALTGPRQSGKSTIVKEIFGDVYTYVSLEDLDTREFAKTDPRGFLAEYRTKIIFDEIQQVPELFSYLQGVVDEDQMPGQFILTGSQHFLLLEKITQSLAGRVAMLHLLPLSLSEIRAVNLDSFTLEEGMYRGFYPNLFTKEVEVNKWYSNYIQTFVERDLRTIKNIHDLGTFQRFLRMCAARTGQLVDYTSIGNDCGITHTTVKSWLNLLEASFIVYFLRPHYSNFNKRLVKNPKLYFYDTGLLCHLLNIQSPDQLKTHYLKGGIFESFVFSEILKARFNQGILNPIYFWRDHKGREIDCIVEEDGNLLSIEVKSGKTVVKDFFQGLNYWNQLANGNPKNSYLIYGGDKSYKRKEANVLSWKDLVHLTG